MSFKPKRVFIVGPTYSKKLIDKHFEIEKDFIVKGYSVVNPMRIKYCLDRKYKNGVSQEIYYKKLLEHLFNCDEIYFLKKWESSDEGILISFVGDRLKLKMVYAK